MKLNIKNGRLIGSIMMPVGIICIILQVLANKSIDLLTKKASSLTKTDKFIIKFKALLLGADTKIEIPTFMSFLGFVWLGLIGILLFTFGYRIMKEEGIETWIWLMIFAVSTFTLSFLCLLFTDASSVFSLDSSVTRTIRIFQHFWHLFLSIPLAMAAYFAHKFFRKKHAVQFGEAKN